jgi:DeoR family transcriptional regulator of aga operon
MVNRAMLRIAREIILVADATKFSKRSLSRIVAFSEIDIVISDISMPLDLQKQIESFGCKLILV